VAQAERLTHDKIPILAMLVVMKIRTAEPSRTDRNLHLAPGGRKDFSRFLGSDVSNLGSIYDGFYI
jgi:hypothetical protein